MNSEKQKYLANSPQDFGESLYWDYSCFENLTTEEVKKCCLIALNHLMKDCDSGMRLYYDLARKHIKQRGVQG